MENPAIDRPRRVKVPQSRSQGTHDQPRQHATSTIYFEHDSERSQLRQRPFRLNVDAAARRDLFVSRLGREIGFEVLNLLNDVFVFVKDADRRFVFYNVAFRELMGLDSEDQLIGLQDEDISPEYLVERYRRDDETVLSGTRLNDVIELVRNSSRGYDWFVTMKSPMMDFGGAIIGILGVTRRFYARQEDNTSLSISGLAPAVELILNQYHRHLTIEELASSVCLSTSQFGRAFKHRFGVSPHQYLRQVRLEAACELLTNSSHSLSMVAELTGFYDQSHMTNVFIRNKGVSPGRYRKRYNSLDSETLVRREMLPRK